jgi:hypothetical protein
MVDGADDPLRFVRGKWIVDSFGRQASHFRDGASLMIATASALSSVPVGFRPLVDSIRVVLRLPALAPPG